MTFITAFIMAVTIAVIIIGTTIVITAVPLADF